jgi:nitroreductase
MLAELLPQYTEIFETASCCLVVFLDLQKSDNRDYDIFTIGAFVENILLTVHALPEMGAVWLRIDDDIKEKINEIFKLSDKVYDLIGIIAIGAIDEEVDNYKNIKRGKRRSVEEFTDWF